MEQTTQMSETAAAEQVPAMDTHGNDVERPGPSGIQEAPGAQGRKRRRPTLPEEYHKRAIRFSQEENDLLAAILDRYEILFGQLSTTTSGATRAKAWAEVQAQVATADGPHRDIESLRKRYCDIKRNIRNELTRERRGAHSTGGSPAQVANLSELERRLLE